MPISQLSEHQIDVLQKFKDKIARDGINPASNGLANDDVTYLRFLRARNFNLNASVAMYKACVEWRSTVLGVGIDELYRRTDPWRYSERSIVASKWPVWFHKTDKKGQPINYQIFTNVDIPGLYKQVKPERVWEGIVVGAETMFREVFPAASKAKGEPITSTLTIVDVKDFSLSQFWGMKYLIRDSFKITQDYYPETLGGLIVINAPASFTVMWNVVKGWMAKETAAKVEVLGSNYKKRLLEIVEEEDLPEHFGGKCKCEGLGGCSLSIAGPWIDEYDNKRQRLYGGAEKSPGGFHWEWTSGDAAPKANGVEKVQHVPLVEQPAQGDDAPKVNGAGKESHVPLVEQPNGIQVVDAN